MEISLGRYRGKTLCVALSGGVDSVCLLHFLKAHAAEHEITLMAAHVEHGIRGEESLRDMRFCKELCSSWKIPLFVEQADVPGLAAEQRRGIEETARSVRYAFFERLLSEGIVEVIATAHHMNDVAETVLFRLARGTSPAGMRAIAERAGIVRPLLSVTRAEIEAYAAENDLPHVEDGTNLDETYARNAIRHTVLPALEKISNGAGEHIARFASLAARDDEYLTELAKEKIRTVRGDSFVPVHLPEPLFFRACLLCMGVKRDYTGANLEEIAALKDLQSGRRVSLPGGLEAAREYDDIVFYRPEPPMQETPFTPNYGELVAESGRNLRVDLDSFPEGCVVRNRRAGDYIVPFGGKKKTLKKFFTDKKISSRLGKKLRLIAHESEILVVLGMEISDKVKVTESTARVGYIL